MYREAFEVWPGLWRGRGGAQSDKGERIQNC